MSVGGYRGGEIKWRRSGRVATVTSCEKRVPDEIAEKAGSKKKWREGMGGTPYLDCSVEVFTVGIATVINKTSEIPLFARINQYTPI